MSLTNNKQSYSYLQIFRVTPTYVTVTISAWVSRVISSIVQLWTVRLLIEGLGKDGYTVYVLLMSLAIWYSLLDFGIGSSLQNYVAEKQEKKEDHGAFILVTALLAIPIILFSVVFLYIISPIIAPLFLAGFGFIDVEEKVRLFFISGSLFAGVTVGSIAYKVWYSLGKGYISNILPAVASVIGALGIWFVTYSGIEQKLIASILAFNLPAALISLLSLGRIFQKEGARRITEFVLRPLVHRALRFWIFSLMAAVTLQVDFLIISQLLVTKALDSTDVIIYSITTRVFNIGFFFFTSFLSAISPISTGHMVQMRWNDVNQMIKRTILMGWVGILVLTLAVILLMPWLLKILIHSDKNFIIPTNFIMLMGGYQLILVWTSTYSMVLQSASLLLMFLRWTPLQTIVSIGGQWFLAQLFGIYGIVLGLMVSFALLATWSQPMALGRYIRKKTMEEKGLPFKESPLAFLIRV